MTAIGLYIAFYYGLTGFACAWYYRKNLTSSARNLWMQGILPAARRPDHVLGGRLGLWAGLGRGDRATATRRGRCRSGRTGRSAATFVIAFVSALVGLIVGIYMRFA